MAMVNAAAPGTPITPARTLVIAPAWIGDAVLSEPLLAALQAQHPDAAIDVFASPWCAPVYARMREVASIIDNPFDHGALSFKRRVALGRSLAGRYQRAIVLPNSMKAALVPFFARIPRRLGYLGEKRFYVLNDRRRLDPVRWPRLVDRFTALAYDAPLVDTAEAQVSASPPPRLYANRAALATTIAKLDLDADRERVVAALCPGAEYGPAKRWPIEHFASLANRLIADNFSVWVIGSRNDRAIADAIGRVAPGIRNLCGQTDLGAAIDLLSVAGLVVSNDSGLMHIAAALERPLIALFGSSSPVYTPPLSPVARVARIDIACSPCFARECPLGHFKCLRDLDPKAVYDLLPAVVPARRAASMNWTPENQAQ